MTHAAERWTAVRALYEATRLPVAVISTATAIAASSIKRKAAAQGWQRLPASLDDLDARLAKLIDQVVSEIEALGLGSQRDDAGLDKARIEAISALTRTLEKIGEIALGRGQAKENQDRDEDIAAALRRIDERIIELARDYAGELVERRASAAGAVPTAP